MGLRTMLGLKRPYSERFAGLEAPPSAGKPKPKRAPLKFGEITWDGDQAMMIDGVRFVMSTSDFTKKTNDTEVVLLKNRLIIDAYRRLFDGEMISNILEFGTFEGGSPIFFAAATNASTIVGVDIRKDAENVQRQTSRYSDRLKIFYGTSQADAQKVHRIIDENFDGPLDLVIDDASHHYNLTKASFDIAFSRLRPGGAYVIEDWNWAHYANPEYDLKFADQPALSNIALELALAVGSGSPISSMEATSWALIIRKGRETGPDFSLDSAVRLRPHRTFHRI